MWEGLCGFCKPPPDGFIHAFSDVQIQKDPASFVFAGESYCTAVTSVAPTPTFLLTRAKQRTSSKKPIQVTVSSGLVPLGVIIPTHEGVCADAQFSRTFLSTSMIPELGLEEVVA